MLPPNACCQLHSQLGLGIPNCGWAFPAGVGHGRGGGDDVAADEEGGGARFGLLYRSFRLELVEKMKSQAEKEDLECLKDLSELPTPLDRRAGAREQHAVPRHHLPGGAVVHGRSNGRPNRPRLRLR